MVNKYKYKLDDSSPRKKIICPSCKDKRKTFVRYINADTGEFLPEEYGRCDRENHCGYHNKPGADATATAKIPGIPSTIPMQDIIYPNGEYNAAFQRESSFHEFAKGLGVSLEHLTKWKVGGRGARHTIFGIVNEKGRLLNVKHIPYQKNGKREREGNSYPFYLSGNDGKKYIRCLYGLHLLDKEKPVIIVESEKTAVLAAFFYPNYNFLATGGNNGMTSEHLQPLLGYPKSIVYLSDNDKAGQESKVIDHLRTINKVSKNITIINPYPDKEEGYDLADFIVENTDKITGDLEKDLGFQIVPEEVEAISEEIDFESVVEDTEPVVMLNNIGVCSVGNIFALMAQPGTGKSHTCEALASVAINPECDGLGFSVSLPEGKTVLYVDAERTKLHCIKGFRRISRRIDVDANPQLRSSGKIDLLTFQSFVISYSEEDRINEMERLVKEKNPGLVIIDDVSMFVADTNDNKESEKVFKWLVALSNRYGFAIACTIHPNPCQDPRQMKPRGHLGSTILRKAEAVYILRKAEEDPKIRVITTDFGHTKTRDDKDVNEAAFTWNEDEHMFTSINYEASSPVVEKVDYRERFRAIYRGLGKVKGESVRSTDLLMTYTDAYSCGPSTGRRHIKDAVDLGILEKIERSRRHIVYQFTGFISPEIEDEKVDTNTNINENTSDEYDDPF